MTTTNLIVGPTFAEALAEHGLTIDDIGGRPATEEELVAHRAGWSSLAAYRLAGHRIASTLSEMNVAAIDRMAEEGVLRPKVPELFRTSLTIVGMQYRRLSAALP
jgi:hypothetical protein